VRNTVTMSVRLNLREHGARNSRRIQAKSGILKSFQKELLLQGFDVSKRLPVIPSGFFFSQENALNEIKLALKTRKMLLKR
jgi:hypothetical protein